ncbi:hypothetical protein VTP01DRAFT_9512 [Rhizomucor pusillus]|uniref:uncharacterized protein n=1 Tax=Rhizomucor pusillus TaxID=4840 RepID=UPI003742C944
MIVVRLSLSNQSVPHGERLFYYRYSAQQLQLYCHSHGTSSLYDTVAFHDEFEVEHLTACASENRKILLIVGWMVFDAFYAVYEYDILSATCRKVDLDQVVTTRVSAIAAEFHLNGTPILAFGHKDGSVTVLPVFRDGNVQVRTIGSADGSAVTTLSMAQNPNEGRSGWRDMRLLFGTAKGRLQAHRISNDFQVIPSKIYHQARLVSTLDLIAIPETRSMVAAFTSKRNDNDTCSTLHIMELYGNGRRRILANLRPDSGQLGNIEWFRLTQGHSREYRIEALYKAQDEGDNVVYHAASWSVSTAMKLQLETKFKYEHTSEDLLRDICYTNSPEGKRYLFLDDNTLINFTTNRPDSNDIHELQVENLDQIAAVSDQSTSVEYGPMMIDSMQSAEEKNDGAVEQMQQEDEGEHLNETKVERQLERENEMDNKLQDMTSIQQDSQYDYSHAQDDQTSVEFEQRNQEQQNEMSDIHNVDDLSHGCVFEEMPIDDEEIEEAEDIVASGSRADMTEYNERRMSPIIRAAMTETSEASVPLQQQTVIYARTDTPSIAYQNLAVSDDEYTDSDSEDEYDDLFERQEADSDTSADEVDPLHLFEFLVMGPAESDLESVSEHSLVEVDPDELLLEPNEMEEFRQLVRERQGQPIDDWDFFAQLRRDEEEDADDESPTPAPVRRARFQSSTAHERVFDEPEIQEDEQRRFPADVDDFYDSYWEESSPFDSATVEKTTPTTARSEHDNSNESIVSTQHSDNLSGEEASRIAVSPTILPTVARERHCRDDEDEPEIQDDMSHRLPIDADDFDESVAWPEVWEEPSPFDSAMVEWTTDSIPEVEAGTVQSEHDSLNDSVVSKQHYDDPLGEDASETTVAPTIPPTPPRAERSQDDKDEPEIQEDEVRQSPVDIDDFDESVARPEIWEKRTVLDLAIVEQTSSKPTDSTGRSETKTTQSEHAIPNDSIASEQYSDNPLEEETSGTTVARERHCQDDEDEPEIQNDKAQSLPIDTDHFDESVAWPEVWEEPSPFDSTTVEETTDSTPEIEARTAGSEHDNSTNSIVFEQLSNSRLEDETPGNWSPTMSQTVARERRGQDDEHELEIQYAEPHSIPIEADDFGENVAWPEVWEEPSHSDSGRAEQTTEITPEVAPRNGEETSRSTVSTTVFPTVSRKRHHDDDDDDEGSISRPRGPKNPKMSAEMHSFGTSASQSNNYLHYLDESREYENHQLTELPLSEELQNEENESMSGESDVFYDADMSPEDIIASFSQIAPNLDSTLKTATESQQQEDDLNEEKDRRKESIDVMLDMLFGGKEKPEMKHIQAFVDGHYTAEERGYILECCLGYNTTYAALFAMHFAFAKHMVQEAVYINGQFQSKFSKIFGLYKGVTSPAAGVALVNALVFGSYEYILSKLQVNGSNAALSSQQPDLSHIMIAGMGAGIVTR